MAVLLLAQPQRSRLARDEANAARAIRELRRGYPTHPAEDVASLLPAWKESDMERWTNRERARAGLDFALFVKAIIRPMSIIILVLILAGFAATWGRPRSVLGAAAGVLGLIGLNAIIWILEIVFRDVSSSPADIKRRNKKTGRGPGL
jgi:hypothetical protein